MSRILLIDDDPHCRELLRSRFKKERYELVEASDGEEGLKLADRQRPDLVILDIRIPKIDGWEVCRRIKSDPHMQVIPVLMLTGCSQDVQESYGRQCGADDYVVKPWDWTRLMAIIGRLLTHHESAEMLLSDNVRGRIKELVRRVMEVISRLPQNETAASVSSQLTRFATSSLAAYQDLGNGMVPAEFVSRIQRVCGDLDELLYWLRLLQTSTVITHPDVAPLIEETESILQTIKHRDRGSRR